MDNDLEFVEIKNFEGFYEINKRGEIKSIDRLVSVKGYGNRSDYLSTREGKLIKPFINASGYVQVKLNVNGKKYSKYVHKLVYDTFVGIKNIDSDIDHLDHDKTNCSLDNLEEVSHAENMRRMREFYGIKAKVKEKKSRRTYTYNEVKEAFERLRDEPMSKVCKDYGISDKGLSKRLKSVGLPYQMAEIKKYFKNN